MALDNVQQTQSLIDKAKNILIVFPEKHSGDALSAALSLSFYLKKINKPHMVCASNFKAQSELVFLPGIEEVESDLRGARHFVLSLDLNNKKLEEFSYDIEADKLKLYLLPDKGTFRQTDINLEEEEYRFDLVICLDAPDLESLGQIYTNAPDLFFKVPLINIDHKTSNENYGHLNLVDVTKASVAEVVFEYLYKINPQIFDSDLATILLSGIISKTESFKKPNLKPITLQIAAKLMALGAEREKIVTSFYRTKTLSKLKLWGRVLARLQYDKAFSLAWSAVPHTDFIKANAEDEGMDGVIEEVISNSPEAKVNVVIYESKKEKIKALIYAKEGIDVRYLVNNFEYSGSLNQVKIVFEEKSLAEAESVLIKEIKNKLESLRK